MSGGVDSAVAAALLKKDGFDVRGIFLRLADTSNFKDGAEDAEKIAQALEIHFSVIDLRKEFQEEVINYFLEQLQKGVTPNPCVICNEKIKLGLLLQRALDLNSSYLATGHYVRRLVENNNEHEVYKLLKGKDENKDQSYFLWRLNQEKLKHLLFPLGNLTKPEVKKIAEDLNISDLIRSESNEICFVRDKLKDFLRKKLEAKPGKIIDNEGNMVGEHEGLHFYTIGQRKGIEIGGMKNPFYVLDKNLENNTLIVTQDEDDLHKDEIALDDINWISGEPPELPLQISVKIRYRHKPVIATINDNYIVSFEKRQRAITPGQSVVFYKGEELIGGGIIR